MHIPFQSEENIVIVNKSYDLLLNGGTIFDDAGVPVNPAVTRKSNLIGNLLEKIFKESKIKFTVDQPYTQFDETLR